MLSLAILIWLMGSTPVVIGNFALQMIWTVIIFYRSPFHHILYCGAMAGQINSGCLLYNVILLLMVEVK